MDRGSPIGAAGLVVAALGLVALAQGGRRDAAEAEREAASQVRPRRSGPIPRTTTEARELARGRPMNINRATREDLMLLPRIGPALAERIVQHRQRNGAFTTLSGLGAVQGIGPRTLERLSPMVTVDRAEPGGVGGPDPPDPSTSEPVLDRTGGLHP